MKPTRRKGRKRQSARWKSAERLPIWIAGGLLFFVFAAIGVQREYGRKHRTVVASAPPTGAVAIFADCQITYFPVALPPQATVHVLGLNPKLMASQHWGLTDISNLTAEATQWPTDEVMEAERRNREANKDYSSGGKFGYTCDVSNHSSVGVRDMAVPITFWYGEHPKYGLKYTVVVSPLDQGSRFAFYVLNDCPANVEGYLPSAVDVTVVGESSRRTVPLHFLNESPVLMFSPSQFQWVRQQPCS